MADYWKSQPKKFCQYCKCWIADNKPSVEFHERGKNHKENVAAKIAEIKKKSMDKAKEEDRVSKEFAAMEEAAMKAFQEDLKRLGAESASAEAQHAKPAVKAEAPSSSGSGTWLEGVSNEGHTYYYNTLTGESHWEKPKGFQGKQNKSKQRQANKKSQSCQWMEAMSSEGYTYYYKSDTGETSWERPAGYRSPKRAAVSGEKTGREDPPPPLPDPPTAEEESTDKATATLEPEGSGVPQVSKSGFRKRKLQTRLEGGAEEDKVDDGDDDDDDGNEEVEDMCEKPTPCDKEEEAKEKEKAEEKEEAVVKKPKKPRKTNPYGDWEQIKEEKDPYENVDLQLPHVEGVVTAPAPSNLPPEPKVKFKERTITSLGDESGAGEVFRKRKRKVENGKSRILRQRAEDD